MLFFSDVRMNPFEFVRHVHTDREKRMCHWGFDPIQWRHYLHLDGKEYAKSRDASLDESFELIQEGLDRLKHIKERFNRRGLKRKKVGLVKKNFKWLLGNGKMFSMLKPTRFYNDKMLHATMHWNSNFVT